MLMVVVALVALVLGLLRGGSLRGLAQISLRWIPLVIAGLVLQLLIFTPGRGQSIIPTYTTQLYILSMVLLAIWVILNRHVPGIVLMGIGLMMNMVAIVANGGYMPIHPDVAGMVGQSRDAATGGTEIIYHSRAMRESVQLWILTDILPVPAPKPLASVFSIGDVLMTLGGSWLLYRSMRRSDTAPGRLPSVPEQADLSVQNDSSQ